MRAPPELRVRSLYTYGTDAQRPSSSGTIARRVRKASVSRSGGVAAAPPAEVAPSTSESTRSGWRSVSSWAIIPPIEIPYTCACAIPAASSTETASAAIPASVRRPAGRSLRPQPRLSNVTTCSERASTGTVRHQASPGRPRPMISSTAGPSPVASKWSMPQIYLKSLDLAKLLANLANTRQAAHPDQRKRHGHHHKDERPDRHRDREGRRVQPEDRRKGRRAQREGHRERPQGRR